MLLQQFYRSVVGGYEQAQPHLSSRDTTFYARPVPLPRQIFGLFIRVRYLHLATSVEGTFTTTKSSTLNPDWYRQLHETIPMSIQPSLVSSYQSAANPDWYAQRGRFGTARTARHDFFPAQNGKIWQGMIRHGMGTRLFLLCVARFYFCFFPTSFWHPFWTYFWVEKMLRRSRGIPNHPRGASTNLCNLQRHPRGAPRHPLERLLACQ